MINSYKLVVGKHSWKIPLERSRCKYNIKMNRKEIWYEGVA